MAFSVFLCQGEQLVVEYMVLYNNYCVMCFRELEKTRVVYIIHTNLCGRIPNKIIDIAIPSSQINFFSRLLKEISNSS